MYPQLQLVPSSQVNNNPTRCNSYAQKQEDPPKLVWSKLEHEYIEEGLMPQCVECNCELGFNNTRQLCHKSYCKALRETEDTVHEFGGRPSFRMHMIRKKNIMKPMFSQAATVKKKEAPKAPIHTYDASLLNTREGQKLLMAQLAANHAIDTRTAYKKFVDGVISRTGCHPHHTWKKVKKTM